MNRRIVMIALGALVAGACALVYAVGGKTAEQAEGAASAAQEVDVTGAATAPQGAPPQISYDFDALPDPVKRMLTKIASAAESGDIEAMRPVFESNELKPMVATAFVDDPIAFWKKASADGTGRDILAAMLNVLSSGYVKLGQGKEEIFVWPYFAATDLAKLTPAQEVELYRIVSPEQALAMKRAGKYAYYRFGITPAGVWQYFLQ
jgi:hypothetical protein